MSRSLFVIALATSLVCACSRSNPQQSNAPDNQAAAPAARADAQAPPAAPAPAATPAAGEQRAATPQPQSQAAAPSPSAAVAQPSAQSATPPTPSEPPAPKFREVTVPAGTRLSVTVLSSLASDTSKVEDRVEGSLAHPVVVSDTTVLPAGATLTGSVTDAKESGRVKGKASIAFRFQRLVARDETYQIHTATVTREAAQSKSSDVKKGAVGAGLGAVVGGVVGGGKGAAIGATAGGAGAVLATKGQEVKIAPGTVVTVLLQEPITVMVPMK